MSIEGLHHIRLICSDAQRTVDFYIQVLGLRFVKKTVNFNDPGAYHLYFGDDTGIRARLSLSLSGPTLAKGARAWGAPIISLYPFATKTYSSNHRR